MAIPENASPIPLLQDLEEQLSHIEPYKLKNCALYQTKSGSYQIVEMNWLNRLIRFIRPSKYDTVAFVDKLCDLMDKSIKNEALPVNYTKLTYAFTRMQGIPSRKLLDIGATLATREKVPEFEAFTKSLNIAATGLPKENIVKGLDACVNGITVPESCRLLRGHPALQQARDLIVKNTYAALQQEKYSLDDFNAILKCIRELDSKLGTKSDYHLYDIQEMRRPLQKLEEKLFSQDLKVLCESLGKGKIPPEEHTAQVQKLLARAERIQLQDPTRFERPLRLISNAYNHRGYYQGAENLVDLLNNFAQKHKIRPAIPASEQETVKQFAKLNSFANSIIQSNYGAESGNVVGQFLKDCEALKIDTKLLQTAAINNPVVLRNLTALHDKIGDLIRFRLNLLKDSDAMLLQYRDVVHGFELLQQKIGFALPSQHLTAIHETRNSLLDPVVNKFSRLQRQVIQNPLAYAQEYSKARQEYRQALTRDEFDAICDALPEQAKALENALLPYLSIDKEYSKPVTVPTENLDQTFDKASYKDKIGKAISGKFGKTLQGWVGLIPNYQSAEHTFAREDLKMTMIGDESAESAIKKLLIAKKIKLETIEPELKVVLLSEVLYERAKKAHPTAVEEELRAMVAGLLAVSPRDFNPIFLPKKIQEALGTYEKDPMDAKYRLPDAAYKDQPAIHYKFEIGMKDGKLQASVELSHVFELKEGLEEKGKQVLFTSKLANEFGNKTAAWQGTLSAKPKV